MLKQSRHWVWLGLVLVALVILAGQFTTTSPPVATPTLPHPSPRPTFSFPTGEAVPVTSAEGAVIETEPGPLYVILSTVDEHGLRGQALFDLWGQPDPAVTTSVGALPSGTFARVLEIRRLPPDYLRGFYLIEANDLTGWVGDYLAHRTVYVIVFDARGCACPGPVPLWADAELGKTAGTVENRAPLRLLSLNEKSVQVQVLSNGAVGWLSRASVHETQENEFLKYIAP